MVPKMTKMLGGPNRWSEHGDKEKNPCTCWVSNPSHWTYSPALYLLSYPSFSMKQKTITVFNSRQSTSFIGNLTQLTWLDTCDAFCFCVCWEAWLPGTPYNLGLMVMECVQLYVLKMPTSRSASSNILERREMIINWAFFVLSWGES